MPHAREGYFVLSWQSSGSEAALSLQRSDSGNFASAETVPVMPSGSLTVTGLRDGVYHFRVGREGNWSTVQQVRVEHHALSTALLWFACGALLFCVLAVVILAGTMRTVREEKRA